MITLGKADVLGLAAGLHAALDAGLFAEVAAAEDGITAETAARALGLDAVATERVLDVLAGARLAARDGDRYTLDPELAAMHRAFPGGLTMTAMLFSTAPAYLRSGAPVIAMDGDVRERAEAYRSAVGGLGALFAQASGAFAAAFADAAGPALPASARVLDVGCGAGVWGLALLDAMREARLTGVDLPGVTDVFRAAAREKGLADRVTAHEGDMHTTPLPLSDVVLLANVLRLETAERAAALVQRLADKVAPGGALVIVDALAEGTPEKDLARSVYALNLALRTRTSGVHAPARVAAWMTDAGLSHVAGLDFGLWPGAVAALVGWRAR